MHHSVGAEGKVKANHTCIWPQHNLWMDAHRFTQSRGHVEFCFRSTCSNSCTSSVRQSITRLKSVVTMCERSLWKDKKPRTTSQCGHHVEPSARSTARAILIKVDLRTCSFSTERLLLGDTALELPVEPMPSVFFFDGETDPFMRVSADRADVPHFDRRFRQLLSSSKRSENCFHRRMRGQAAWLIGSTSGNGTRDSTCLPVSGINALRGVEIGSLAALIIVVSLRVVGRLYRSLSTHGID